MRLAPRSLLRSATFVALATVAMAATRTGVATADTGTPQGRQQPPTCPMLIFASNSGVGPIFLDVNQSASFTQAGDSASFAQGPGNTPVDVRLEAFRSSSSIGTRAAVGACGSSRRYRFVFRNLRGTVRTVWIPATATFTNTSQINLGDVHLLF